MKPLQNVQASCFMNTVLQGTVSSNNFNAAILGCMNKDSAKTLSDPILGAYCRFIHSVVNDKVVNVSAFVGDIRKLSDRWVGMCDSFEFYEYLCDAIERASGLNLLSVKQSVYFELDCGHTGVVDSRDEQCNHIRLSQLQKTQTQGQITYCELIDYKCAKCLGDDFRRLMKRTTVTELPRVLAVVVDIPMQAFSDEDLLQYISNDLTLSDAAGLKTYKAQVAYCYSGFGIVGHYHALVRNNDNWFLCNDQQILHIPSLNPRQFHGAKTILYEQLTSL